MPLIIDDSFEDFAREHRLPDCAVSFVTKAGSWSARTSKSGFVPSTMLAQFTDDPALVTRTLCAAGILKRVKAGVRFTGSGLVTVVNARDVHRDTERQEAEAEARREAWRAKKQQQRATAAAARRERIASAVPAMSPGTNADVPHDVPPENPADSGKPQVNRHIVPGDIRGTSQGTPKTAASDYQDQDQSSGVSQINARAREAPSPGTLARVTAGTSKKLRRAVSETEACRAIAEWDRRAKTAGEVIHDPDRYYATCIRREKDLDAILTPPPPAPPPEWLAPPPASGPGVHAYQPDRSPFIDACAHPGCGLRKSNARHVRQEAGTG